MTEATPSLYNCFCSKPFGMYARKRSNASTSLGVPFFSCKSKFLVSKRITPANNNPISSRRGWPAKRNKSEGNNWV